MRLLALSVTGLVFLAGCGLQTKIEDIAKKEPQSNSPSPMQIKISGGAGSINGATTTFDFSIGLKDRVIKGSNYDLQATISAHRPEY